MNRIAIIGLFVVAMLSALASSVLLPHTQSHAAAKKAPAAGQKTAVFAMGCFWCAEADFEKVPGVTNVVSGYIGGTAANATYDRVSAGGTGHYEAVKVTYDPKKISYGKILAVFWRNVDPFDAKGQFCDKGSSYRAAIFPDGKVEMAAATASLKSIEDSFGRAVSVKIIPRTTFYAAEDYHQDYYKKNPIRYDYYRGGCGRDARLKQVWGAPK